MRAVEHLGLASARRIALAAQGFADRRPTGIPDRRHLRRVLGRTQLGRVAAVNRIRTQQAKLGLDPQDPPDRVVNSRHRQGAVARFADGGFEQTFPAIGSHGQIEACLERQRAIGDRATRNLAMAIPIAHN